MKALRKYYDMFIDSSVGAYKDQDGDWVEYFKKPSQNKTIMIKANELRIGNYLNFMEDSTVFMVNEIAETGISCSNETETTWIELDQFSGINLTPEILDKVDWNGYVKLHINSYFSIDNVGHLYYHSDYTGINIDYVHQLQNLYFSLTGKELECAF